MNHKGRPAETEYARPYAGYVARVPEENVIEAMEAQTRETAALLASIDEAKAGHRYAEGKWSIKQLVGHIADGERVFAYRALCIARGDTNSLPGFDETTYAAHANFDARPFREIADDFAVARAATLSMLRGFDDEAWQRMGTANEVAVSVRALAYMLLGHERHHVNVLRERYLG
jgi:uncharacterized damage-inducible protein DinB